MSTSWPLVQKNFIRLCIGAQALINDGKQILGGNAQAPVGRDERPDTRGIELLDQINGHLKVAIGIPFSLAGAVLEPLMTLQARTRRSAGHHFAQLAHGAGADGRLWIVAEILLLRLAAAIAIIGAAAPQIGPQAMQGEVLAGPRGGLLTFWLALMGFTESRLPADGKHIAVTLPGQIAGLAAAG